MGTPDCRIWYFFYYDMTDMTNFSVQKELTDDTWSFMFCFVRSPLRNSALSLMLQF